MNIQKHLVPGNFATGRKGNNVTGIVLHTMVGTTQGAQSRFNNPSSGVSVHYGVSLDGVITQWVEEYNTAYQAGNWQVNLTTIGIEHEDAGNYNGPRTDALYEASSSLVADICKRYSIPCDTDHIFRHGDVIDKTAYPGGTACPDALDADRIISMAKAKLGDDMKITTAADVNLLWQLNGINRAPTEEEVQQAIGRDLDEYVSYLLSTTPFKANLAKVKFYDKDLTTLNAINKLIKGE